MMRKTAIFVVALLFFVLIVSTAWAEDTFVWPVNGEIIKHFDPDEHRGVDIAANAGDNVLSSQDGVVNWIGRTPRGEPCISIDHPSGLTSTYLPVRATVSKGQSVNAGDVLGTLSSEIDKSSDVEHLHLGLFDTSTRDNKIYVNPEDYLPEVANAVEPADGDNGTEQAPVSRPEGTPEAQLASNPVVEIQDAPQSRETAVRSNVVPAVAAATAPATVIEEPSFQQATQGSPPVMASSAKSTVEVETVAMESDVRVRSVIGVKPNDNLERIAGVKPTGNVILPGSMRQTASVKPAVDAEISNPSPSNSSSSAIVSRNYGIDKNIRHIEKEAPTLKLNPKFSMTSLARIKSKGLFLALTTLLLVIIVTMTVSALLARRMSRARETLIISPSAIGSSLSC